MRREIRLPLDPKMWSDHKEDKGTVAEIEGQGVAAPTVTQKTFVRKLVGNFYFLETIAGKLLPGFAPPAEKS